MEAKIVSYGGNPKVVVAEPDIKEFKLSDEMDYIFLGCKFSPSPTSSGDGIFDNMSNYDVNRTIWDTLLQSTSDSTAEICGEAVD